MQLRCVIGLAATRSLRSGALFRRDPSFRGERSTQQSPRCTNLAKAFERKLDVDLAERETHAAPYTSRFCGSRQTAKTGPNMKRKPPLEAARLQRVQAKAREFRIESIALHSKDSLQQFENPISKSKWVQLLGHDNTIGIKSNNDQPVARRPLILKFRFVRQVDGLQVGGRPRGRRFAHKRVDLVPRHSQLNLSKGTRIQRRHEDDKRNDQ